jgi:branched-chain amino acid transport system substrate-binding protein
MKRLILATLATASMIAIAAAQELKIGITAAVTGPAAALGGPIKNTIAILPETIGGLKVTYIALDDGGDPTVGTTNARKLITEDKVDVIVGGAITPVSIAVNNVATETMTPHFALSPMPLPPEKAKWTVVMPQPVPLMAKGLFDHMKKAGVKTVGLIGFADSWGDLWLGQIKAQAEPMGIKMVADERFARPDTSVTGQALKLLSVNPDVILVAASGTGAALPQKTLREVGFKGTIYQTHGAVSFDFIRVAGASAEGVVMASGPVVAAEGQDDKALTKAPGVDYVTKYEAKYGPNTRTQFGAHMYDAVKMLERVVPVALKTSKPGTQEFKEAIRAALISEKEIAASQGVYNFTDADRYGVDGRSAITLTIKNGKFEVLK